MDYLHKKYGDGKLLYFGDSLCGDLLPCKDCEDWDSVGFIDTYTDK